MAHDATETHISPVVAVHSLTKVLGRGVEALRHVDLTVQRGRAMGLAGPNGAGKSTLLRILLGLVRPTSGQVELFGEAVRPGMAALARVGALIDGPGFVPYLTGRQNLRLTVRTSGKKLGDGELEEALASSGLGSALDRPYRTYSHGMRYRLGLAQALMGHPELLLLDEPTTGLDPGHAAEVISHVRNASAAGTTVILSSHELPLLEQLCTEVTVLHQGRVALGGAIQDLVRSAGSLHGAYVAALEQPELRSPAGEPAQPAKP
ncbi:MAG: ABC transporter ATP-binding protein [Acidimicrobiales bacterium]|nr:ABC transporter ATP-binding protein [Acidimicrobiales bacterium]